MSVESGRATRSRLGLLVGLLLIVLGGALWLTLGSPEPTHAPAVGPTQTVRPLPPTSAPPTPSASVPATAPTALTSTTPGPPTARAGPPPATDVPPTATAGPLTATDVPPTATAEPPTATDVPPTATAPPPVARVIRPTATARPPAPPRPAITPAKPGTARVSTPTPPHLVTVYANVPRYGDPRPADPRRVVHISSPAVSLNADVVEVYIQANGLWQVADYAAGHHWGTANPGGGNNIVITGHNNWRGEVFRYLEALQPGQTILVTTADGNVWRYVVQQMQKLPEKNVGWGTQMEHAEVMLPTGFERLTLITCWPYKTFTHRLVIYAAPVR